ncbi:hypothetical protein BD289DRAFT_455665 [Coniella lustricola]|uniref:Acetylserotonin methytransferase-like protein n=1 Tax=Coniella lustricola TaxID=2025994 RepID=A0A2T2ZYY7_9PEZI|nr:hypothetical protein BD289DRAFT_455665 [Coniella lustricola]
MSPRMPQGSAGAFFSLFPKERSPSRSGNQPAGPPPPTRPSIDSVTRDSPSRTGRRTPLERNNNNDNNNNDNDNNDDNNNNNNNMSAAAGKSKRPQDTAGDNTSILQRPAPVALARTPPPRCDTAFSEAQTLVRDSSTRSRNSIAKLPLAPQDRPGSGPDGDRGRGDGAAPIRSIFPEYNPDLSLAEQSYYPTHTSPTHIPPEAISRRLYSPTSDTHPTSSENNNHTGPQSPPLRSPQSAATANTASHQWPPLPRTTAAAAAQAHPTQPPEISTTEQLRSYWKVANGWRASASEGRVYTFKVSCERDAPVYTLASRSQQPLYRIKLDPTSTSAYVSVSRFDPAKVYKPPVPPKDNNTSNNDNSNSNTSNTSSSETDNVSAGKETSARGWQEVLATMLEEKARHHAPHDGLVALLFPSAAAKMARESQHTNAAACATAERECARLVWDDDSGLHYLVHPALAMPFCVTIERNTTWSRTEYTLEHLESPRHLARLTRDGTGTGWLEVDTSIASKIDAVYLADVAVTALLLVGNADGEFSRVEVFEPPPSMGEDQNNTRSSSRLSRLSSRIGTGGEKKRVGKSPLEAFELDLESQMSDLKKHSSKDKNGTPGCARVIISILGITFKCCIWCATLVFKALTGCIALIAKCVTSEKL